MDELNLINNPDAVGRFQSAGFADEVPAQDPDGFPEEEPISEAELEGMYLEHLAALARMVGF